MKISVRWLNEYLEPGNVTSDEAQHVLTHVGFPIETAEAVAGGDVCLDVEVTSNRGDVLSHIGVAREIAAATGRRLKLPASNKVFDWSGETPTTGSSGGVGGDIGGVVAVENRVHAACPMFTARVIRGVKVGPSPKWLVDALAAVGQRSINSVVDVTNFVAFEYGQPTHVFDLASLQPNADGKARVVVRSASKGEKLKLLDGKEITLLGDEIVVADEGMHEPRAISLAGVMGGLETEVSEKTVDVLLEAATWDPVAVRRAARRFGIRTDASYRFERIVDARTIEGAARRAAGLIVRLAGGKALPGVIHAGAETKALTRVSMRTARCAAMLGVEVAAPRIQQILESLEIVSTPGTESGTLVCTVPAHRPDLEREIDLIEEVARINGLDTLPVHEKLGTRVSSPQASEAATRELARVLGGLGFFETITFTFVSKEHAKAFTPMGLKTLEVCDGRRSADPVVRPSALASLLACRRANQDAGNAITPGSDQELGIRLFEISAAIAEKPTEGGKKGERGTLVERINLAMIADACFPIGAKAIDQKQTAVRLVRGAIEACVQAMAGADARVDVRPLAQSTVSGFDPAAVAEVVVVQRGKGGGGEQTIGVMGLIAPGVQSQHGLQMPVAAAELSLEALVQMYPPKALAHALPAFPSIERDLSLIVPEQTAWSKIEGLVVGAKPALLEQVRFVGTYRGQQAGAGKKSVTLRMRFRDDRRTLTHDEVTPQVEGVIALAKKELGAEVRTQ